MTAKALRILLADDSSIARDLLRASIEDVLGKAGYGTAEILEVADGAQAIERLAREKLDLLVLDFLLPSANGEAVLKRIRSTPETAGLPVIVVSCGPEEIERKAMAAGASCFLTKPVVTSRLAKAIKDALGKSE